MDKLAHQVRPLVFQLIALVTGIQTALLPHVIPTHRVVSCLVSHHAPVTLAILAAARHVLLV